MPKFKHKNVKRKAPAPEGKKEKKKYTPFPPANHIPESKIDKQLETGEYFLTESQKQRKAKMEKMDKAKQKSQERREERKKAFIAPADEKVEANKAKAKAGKVDALKAREEENLLQTLADKMKQPKKKQKRSSGSASMGDFVAGAK